MAPSAEPFDLQKQLWEISNVITGFSILKALAFGYFTLKDEWRNKVKEGGDAVCGAVSIIGFAILAGEIAAVLYCGYAMARMGKTDDYHLLTNIAWGRAGAILAFGIAFFLAVWGPRLEARRFGCRQEVY